MKDPRADVLAAESERRLAEAEKLRAEARRDWWLSSDECLRFGLVDEVR
jgi:ATP-dependent protease ClpP protease subunit